MTMHSLITLSNATPNRLTPNGTHSGIDITIQNVNDSGYIYIGGDDQTSDTNYGFRIMPNHSISFELHGRDAIYAVSSVNSMKIAVIKINLESGS